MLPHDDGKDWNFFREGLEYFGPHVEQDIDEMQGSLME